MRCSKCGNELYENDRFCNKCGTKLEPVVVPAAIAEPERRVCSSCGADLAEGMKFCIRCGASVGVGPVSSTVAEEPEAVPAKPRKEKKGKKGGLVVLIVLLLAALGVGGFFGFRAWQEHRGDEPEVNIRGEETKETEEEPVESTEKEAVETTQAPEVIQTEPAETEETQAPEVIQTEPAETEETQAPEVIQTEPMETEAATEPTREKVFALNHTDVTLSSEGEAFTLTATVDGAKVDGSKVQWKSSDSSVATVNAGKVTAVGPGKATITATYNGQTAQCIIRCNFEEVTEPTNAPTETVVQNEIQVLEIGDVKVQQGYNRDAGFGVNDYGSPVYWEMQIEMLNINAHHAGSVACSWDDSVIPINGKTSVDGIYPDYGWAAACSGLTLWRSSVMYGNSQVVCVALPDNKTIEGSQWVTVTGSKDGVTYSVTIHFTLTCDGDYKTGTGWSISNISKG